MTQHQITDAEYAAALAAGQAEVETEVRAHKPSSMCLIVMPLRF
jgi:hypothetical protein